MPVVEAMFDSNVLIYALPRHPQSPAKQARAWELIAQTKFGISFQVLQEVFVTVTRKIQRPLPSDEALRILMPFLSFPLVTGTPGLFLTAVRMAERYQIHYYDAAILAAAKELEAPTLYSEDMGHGQVYDGVRVINPFQGLD